MCKLDTWTHETIFDTEQEYFTAQQTDLWAMDKGCQHIFSDF